MNRRREIGTAVVWSKTQGSYCLRPDDWPALREAWLAGAAFFEGRSLHGDMFVIKLGAVEAIQLFTPKGLQSQRDEEEADKVDDTPLSFT